MFSSEVQFEKAPELIFVTEAGNSIVFSDLQNANAYEPIEVTVSGIKTVSSEDIS